MKNLDYLRDLIYRVEEFNKSAIFLNNETEKTIKQMDELEAAEWFEGKDEQIEKLVAYGTWLLKQIDLEKIESDKLEKEIKEI